ncbi:mechanosensitive ion channel family protein [Limnochorda pilosa]|uniref:Mechanosensitive ion channel protein MscS n=1 Tax=Limnochorda pilosa TaxID=1555112 RepID=A0A0K2SIK7_LIMPI|nr:mechanosensitive ion channel family protein [Limnochorda pilosa]BAS26966.1 mechanosensitive ion channel protein MscS [Limnochorda pilosa]
MQEFLANLAQLDRWAPQLLSAVARLALVLVLAWVLNRVSRPLIHRLDEAFGRHPERSEERQRRIQTLLTIVEKVASAAIWTVAVIMGLQVLGVNTAALLTAAGVGGLAFGFGAQNLVRDFISGFFILAEDQIRVGDVAVINGTGGLVQAINPRTTVLRDLNGTVHVFPNGSIQTVSNLTKEWSRYVIDVSVAYKEDVDRVMEVLRSIGQELQEDPEYRPLIVQPLEVLGVDDFGASGVTIKTMITTLPLKQWQVGRELRRRIKKRFDAEGIEIPFPHTSLYWGSASQAFRVQVETGQTDADRVVEEVLRRLGATQAAAESDRPSGGAGA